MTKKVRNDNGQFVKGVSGNPKGRPPKTSLDGWASALTGIGSVFHDKRLSHNFEPISLTYQQAIDMWKGDDLAARAIEMPVDDCFRQGYEISIADEGDFEELKEQVRQKLQELKVDEVVAKAMYFERAYGGGAILIGVNDSRPLDEPMDRSRATGIEFLTVLEPIELQAIGYYNDPAKPKYGEVEYYQLNINNALASWGKGTPKTAANKKQAKGAVIHESRLLVFEGIQVSRYDAHAYSMCGEPWGASILVRLAEILRDFNIAWHAAGIVVTDFSQAVFSIENLMGLVARDTDALIKRMQALEMGRSVARAVLVDTKETFQRQTTPVAGLPELLHQLSQRLAAGIDIPLSLLMGSGSKTDSAEMGNELRYYYDKIASIQQQWLAPILRMFVEFIMRGLRQRKLPKRWSIKFHPLWQLTDEQRANARLAQARVDAIYIKHGVTTPDEIRKARFGGDYSFETVLPSGTEAPGFAVLPPKGVLVGGKDPKTGLPPGEQANGEGGTDPGNTGGHEVRSYARRNPRQTSMAGTDQTAGGTKEPTMENRDALDEPGESDEDLGG